MDIQFDRLWEDLSEQFALGDHSLHGPSHWRRVEENGLLIAKENGADRDVVRLFAVIHDSQRQSESTDPLHGERAAAICELLQSDYFKLDDYALSTLMIACEKHHHGGVSDDPTVGACWDADRLDLPRVGMFPELQYMSTEAGKQFAKTWR